MSSATENQSTPIASSSGSNDPTIFLRNARFSVNQAPAVQTESVTASDVLGGAFDPTKLHPMAGLSDQLDYLNLEDDKTNELPGSTTALPSRGWSDDLCYGTGTTYLSGEYTTDLRSVVSSVIMNVSFVNPHFISIIKV